MIWVFIEDSIKTCLKGAAKWWWRVCEGLHELKSTKKCENSEENNNAPVNCTLRSTVGHTRPLRRPIEFDIPEVRVGIYRSGPGSVVPTEESTMSILLLAIIQHLEGEQRYSRKEETTCSHITTGAELNAFLLDGEDIIKAIRKLSVCLKNFDQISKSLTHYSAMYPFEKDGGVLSWTSRVTRLHLEWSQLHDDFETLVEALTVQPRS